MKIVHIYATKPNTSHKDVIKFPILSWGIRLFTWFHASHVMFYIPSMKKGCHVDINDICWFDNTKLDEVVILDKFEVTLDEYQFVRLLDFLNGSVKKQSGYMWQLFGIMFGLPFKLLNFNICFVSKSKSITCAEFVSRGLLVALNINLIRDLHCYKCVTEREVVESLGHFSDKATFIKKI